MPTQPAVNHLQRYQGDTWTLPVVVQNSTTNAGVDFTGYNLFCDFTPAGYTVATTLNVANGGLVWTTQNKGAFNLVIPPNLSALCTPLYALGNLPQNRAKLYYVDPNGVRQTLGVIFFDVFDGSEDIALGQQGQLTIVWEAGNVTIYVASTQGAAGPTNIAVAQITDAGATGASLLKASSAAQALAIIGGFGGISIHLEDQNYTIVPGVALVCFDALSADRVVTLANPQQFGAAKAVVIMDGSGECAPNARIHVVAPPNSTIKGSADLYIDSAFDCFRFVHNDANLWTY